MDFKITPSNLQINNIDLNMCPCCNNKLLKEIKKSNYKIKDCNYCRYLDRPFGGCGNTASNHYGGCSCEYGESDFLYITCKKCESLKCIDCKKLISCNNNNCSKNNKRCLECSNKYEFNKKWKTSTAQEKLILYGIEKLKILSKNKNIKGYTKLKKQELIDVLLPLVNNNDFPIKTIN